MSTITGIKLISGIKEIIRMYPNLKVTPAAQKLVSRTVEEVIDKMLSTCAEKFKPTEGQNEMTLDIVSLAIREIFNGEVRNCAIAEGNKSVMRYSTGLLHYEPKIRVSVRSKSKDKKSKRPLGTEFSKGIVNLRHSMFPEASLHVSAKDAIIAILLEVSKKISSEAKASGQQQKVIKPNDIRKAVQNILPKDLRTHALTEGTKMLFFHESGAMPLVHKRRKSILVKGKFEGLKPTRKRRLPKSARSKKRAALRPLKKSRAARKVKKTTTSTKRPRKRKISRISVDDTPVPKRRKVGRKISARRKFKKPSIIPERKKSAKEKTKMRGKIPKMVKKRAPKSSTKRVLTKQKRRPSVRKRRVTKKKVSSMPSRPYKGIRPYKSAKKRTIKLSKKEKAAKMPKIKEYSSKSKKTKRPIKSVDKKAADVAAVSQGIKLLNEYFEQSLSSDATKLINSNLTILFHHFVDEIKATKHSNIGQAEVRDGIMKVFPSELRELALARLSQVLMNYQYA